MSLDQLIEVAANGDRAPVHILARTGGNSRPIPGSLGTRLTREPSDPPRPAQPSLGIFDPHNIRPRLASLHDPVPDAITLRLPPGDDRRCRSPAPLAGYGASRRSGSMRPHPPREAAFLALQCPARGPCLGRCPRSRAGDRLSPNPDQAPTRQGCRGCKEAWRNPGHATLPFAGEPYSTWPEKARVTAAMRQETCSLS